MLTIKGFVTDNTVADNTSGIVNPLCELSSIAESAAIDKGIYTLTSYDRISLYTFQTVDDTGTYQIIPTPIKDIILGVCKEVHVAALAGHISATADLVSNLTTTFDGIANTFAGGLLVTGTIPGGSTITMPEWVSFKVGTDDAEVKVWFADQSFRNQYQGYQYVIVPPVSNLDVLFSGYAAAVSAMKAVTMSDTMSAIYTATKGVPSTMVRTLPVGFVNQQNATEKYLSNWSIAIYGLAGNNIDLLKAGLVTYILANSSHTAEEWKVVLPDLFTSTEFVIAPCWDLYSVPNKQIEAGVHSPSIKTSDAYLRLTALCKYPVNHVKTYAVLSGVSYKSLLFMSVGSPENRDGVVDFITKFPDYINTPTSLPDFGRMAARTQEWVLLFIDAIRIAEELTASTDLPAGYTRITRDSHLFVAFSYENVQYLVKTPS